MTDSTASRTRRIAIALSGGGHRAPLFGLGVLLYLTDAERNSEVVSVSSVSGGSLTNAWLAQREDYSKLTAEELESQVVRPFVRQVAHYGTLWASWTTWLYVVALFISLLSLIALWWLPVGLLTRSICFAIGLVGWGLLAALRSMMCALAFQRTLYSADGYPTLLREIRRENVQHVICATDVRAGQHVYFSGDFVCSYQLGWGRPGEFRLADAVQASAAFPGGFPPRWLATKQHSFVEGARATPHFMVLSDGGVYDNMAEQWPIGVRSRKNRWPTHSDVLKEPDTLVVSDASGPMRWAAVRGLRIPAIGEVFALLRVIRVLYDKTTAKRRSTLVDRFDRAARNARGLEGALIMINRSPYWTAHYFSKKTKTWPERAERASRVLQVLGDENRKKWDNLAKENSRVKTTLWRLGGDVPANLLCHGYVSAMANLHVILGFPLLAVPSIDRFRCIVAGDK
ncbi:MAG: hypothetical protein F4146_03000 [Rhodothermaceae bacterium]|nr:hypothetical protein [Rhodothermaceae bacterium]